MECVSPRTVTYVDTYVAVRGGWQRPFLTIIDRFTMELTDWLLSNLFTKLVNRIVSGLADSPTASPAEQAVGYLTHTLSHEIV